MAERRGGPYGSRSTPASPSSLAGPVRPTAEKPSMVVTRRLGMVGLGQMGLPIVQRLLAEDHPVTFYARRPEVSSELVASGAVDGRSLAGVATNSDVVIICVYDDDDVKKFCLGAEGVIANMKPGSVLVNHTTGDPATARLLSRHARVRWVHFLDAALSGSPADIADAKFDLSSSAGAKPCCAGPDPCWGATQIPSSWSVGSETASG